MWRESVAVLQCPACGGALSLGGRVQLQLQVQVIEDERGVVEGEMRCDSCDRHYPVRHRVASLIDDRRLTEVVRNEIRGWESLFAAHGRKFTEADIGYSLRAPYTSEGWGPVKATLFDAAMHEMALRGGECILDLGAGQGWAARRFAERGCTVFASDIRADVFGLAGAWEIMQRTNTRFETIAADALHLPFQPNTFDIVFACAALHHFEHLDGVLAQLRRVLKPGGYVLAIGEPSISILRREQDIQADIEETQHGITERRPRVNDYVAAFRRCGFAVALVESHETYNATPQQVRAWLGHMAAHAQRTNTLAKYARPWIKLALSALGYLPHRLAARIALYATGGPLLLKAVKR